MTLQITCVLNVFKRPQYFEEQLQSILNQTIPPTRIIVWNNNPNINLSSYACENIIVISSSRNLGVWARFFSLYYLLSGEFVCVFDDDTIPGCNWFKNCLGTIKTHNALLGTIGVIYNEGNNYNVLTRFGWDGPCERPTMVDIVGHSWFFRKEWISTLIKELPNIDIEHLTCGEDIHLSYVLQKYLNIPTIVPPHPESDTSLWGAFDREKSKEYGTHAQAISMQPDFYSKFDTAFKQYVNKGFETINNKAAAIKVYSNCLDYFISRIKNKKHFAIMRCADGEYAVSNNKGVRADDWEFKSDSIISKHFNNTLNLINSNVFYGISGPSDSVEICNYWMNNIINAHNITYANIFVNTNYSKWENFLTNSYYNCVLISHLCPPSGKLGGMKIIEHLSIDKYLVNNWEIEYKTYFDLVTTLAKSYTNMLFFVSAGPIANIFIHHMYLENPNNTYIDCGSSIDVITKGVYTRSYQYNSNAYTDKENLPIVYSGGIQKFKNVIDFRFLTMEDEYNTKYLWWSRIYEYPYVLNMLNKLGATKSSTIHNTSWGFEGVHVFFKDDIDAIYDNALHSDIKESELRNTMVYDITKPIDEKFKNYFDFVLNVSTVEEINYDTVEIIKNLLYQVKKNGYLIITFDYDSNNCNSFGNGSMNLGVVENYLNKRIETKPEFAISGINTICQMSRFYNLNCGCLVIQKL